MSLPNVGAFTYNLVIHATYKRKIIHCVRLFFTGISIDSEDNMRHTQLTLFEFTVNEVGTIV